MNDITTQTIIEGGILITLIFIGGVLVRILRTAISIDNTVKGQTGPKVTDPNG